MSDAFESWAITQLSRLLPLDDDSLKQVISHAQSLPKDAASENFKSLLGDSPQAFEFISSFNIRRPNVSATSGLTSSASQDQGRSVSSSAVPKTTPKAKKKKQPLNKLPSPRLVQDHGESQRAYKKRDEEDYMPGKKKDEHSEKLSNTLTLNQVPSAKQTPAPSRPSSSTDATSTPATARGQSLKLPPSAAGSLISDSPKSSRSSSPAKRNVANATPKTKVNLTGGKSMRGASTALSELDSAIRSLEIQTDPTLAPAADSDTSERRCNCQAQRHALIAAAPNCLSCGKIICAKEGLGPCTFCETPLLNSSEIQAMLRILKEERGKEKMSEHNAAHKKADVSRSPRPFASLSTTPESSMPASGAASDTEGATDKSLDVARAHRDRLLKFQAENAKRTQIHDEVADFDTPDVGLNMWASPLERAQQLKRQQRVLREQEWNAKQDYEKRKMVMSLDVKGGKAVRRMQEVSKEEALSESEDEEVDLPLTPDPHVGGGAGFPKNPLLGELIRPIYDSSGDQKGKSRRQGQRPTWTRVQDDNDDNEQWILDGGTYGDRDSTIPSTEEPSCG